jgi:hypothetical protein
MSAVLQNVMAKMGPAGSQTPPGQPGQPLPASFQASNGQSGIMQALSGLFGGGNPQQDQNNAMVQGKVNEYMANIQAAHAKANADAQKAAGRSLKQSLKTITPPQGGQPGSGILPPSQIQQMIQSAQAQNGQSGGGFQGKVAGQ